MLDVVRLSIWFAILCVVFIPLEHIFAERPQKVLRKQIGNDLIYYVLSWLLPPMVMAVPLLVVAWAARQFIPSGFHATIAEVPFWARAIVALVVGDIGYYWGHRCLHTVPFLWRFHSVHHSAEDVDFLTNTRLHPLDMAFGRLSGLIPVYALGLAAPTAEDSLLPVVIVLTGTLWGFFIHANLRWHYGPLEWVIGTPPFHRWHHALTPANRNFASLLPWIDMIFGTYHSPKGQSPSSYGIPAPMPGALADQLIFPFLPAPPGSGAVSRREADR
ncbi:MAG: sterol desaturase family protein [Acetobacteraceae bacterium]|nr:sterol desaturase family protein [Acetobacteraceae bacterium]